MDVLQQRTLTHPASDLLLLQLLLLLLVPYAALVSSSVDTQTVYCCSYTILLQVTDMFNPEFFLGAYKASGDGPWKPAALYTGWCV